MMEQTTATYRNASSAASFLRGFTRLNCVLIGCSAAARPFVAVQATVAGFVTAAWTLAGVGPPTPCPSA